MDPLNRLTSERSATATPSFQEEESRLEEAMKRADGLLVSSLRHEERRRRKTRLRILLLSLGGLTMIAAFGLGLLLLLQAHKTLPSAPVAMAGGESAQELTREGMQLWRQGQYDAAISKFQAAIQADPNLVEAWNGLGWSQFNSGHADDALKTFQHIVELDPKHPAALNGLGQIYFSRNQFDKAEPCLLRAAPSAPAACWGLAKIYLLTEKWDQAAVYAQKIIDSGQAAGTDADFARRMLRAAQDKNLPDDLRQLISPAAQVDPRVQQGWQALNQNNFAKARQLFEQVLAANPNDADALNGMGWLSVRTGKLDTAQSSFEAALKIDPKAAGAMNGLALVNKQQGRMDEAIKLWQQMVEQFPGVNAGTYGLADAYYSRQQFDKAIPLYEQIVQVNPDDRAAQTKLNDARKQVGAK